MLKFDYLNLARGISEAGNAVRQAILALAILSLRDRAEDIFFAEVLETAGVVLALLIGSFFVDRVGRRVSLAVADLLCVLNSALLFVGALHQIVEVMFLGSFFATFFGSYYKANFEALVSDLNHGHINKLRFGLSVAQLSLLLGALFGLIGTTIGLSSLPLPFFFLLDGLTFVLSSALVLRSRKNATEVSRTEGELKGSWFEGFKRMLQNSGLKALIVSGFFGGVVYGAYESAVVVHLKQVVNLSDEWVTGSRIFNRLAAIIAMLLVVAPRSPGSRMSGSRVVWGGGTLATCGLFLHASENSLTFLGAGVLFNFGLALINPALGAIIGVLAPREILGRVYFAYSLWIYLGVLVGNLAVLQFGPGLGTGAIFMGAAAGYLIRLFFGLLAHPK